MGGIELGSTEQCYNLEYMVVNIVVITRSVNIITWSTEYSGLYQHVIPMSVSVITRSTSSIFAIIQTG